MAKQDVVKDSGALNTPISLDDSDDDMDMLRIWAPMNRAKPPLTVRPKNTTVGLDGGGFSVWTCPEIELRARTRALQQQRAVQLVRRIAAAPEPKNAMDVSEASGLSFGAMGKRRRVSDTPEPISPVKETHAHGSSFVLGSPELVKPQSLLIPELFPKEMFRQPVKPTQTILRPVKKEPASVPDGDSGGIGLGLDLGFDLASSPPPPSILCMDQSSGNDTSSIMEITEFLEKDIDVFTPLGRKDKRVSRSSAFAVPPPIDFSRLLSGDRISGPGGLSRNSGLQSKSNPQDLVGDILNMKF
ncbi:hypothetical protein GGI07_000576 [Coemansia sp. Benny D115]|nr:hypothetical protein GGI07_000576 [Coemansia sp. Benny D115]